MFKLGEQVKSVEMHVWAVPAEGKFPCGLGCFARHLEGLGNKVLEIDAEHNRVLISYTKVEHDGQPGN